MRCHIFIGTPFSSSKTVLSICIGNFLLAIFSVANFSFSVLTHARIDSGVNDWKPVLLLVFYSGSEYCVSFNLWNDASFVPAMKLVDRLGGIIIGGGLGSDFWISFSTLGGGMVLFGNGGSVLAIVYFYLFGVLRLPSCLFPGMWDLV